VVVEAHAVSNPGTMMVHLKDAFATQRAMMCSWRLNLVTFTAPSVNDIVLPGHRVLVSTLFKVMLLQGSSNSVLPGVRLRSGSFFAAEVFVDNWEVLLQWLLNILSSRVYPIHLYFL